MKFTVLKDELVRGLQKVSSAVDSKAVIPSLQGILIKAFDKKLTLQGYNLELGIIANVTDVAIAEEGEIVIESKTFYNIISKAPDVKISVDVDEKGIVKIKSGKSRFKIVGISADDYPELPKIKEDFSAEFEKASILSSVIKTLEYACDERFNKPIFTGLLFEFDKLYLSLVATDGKRMAYKKIAFPSDKEYTTVVPKKALTEMVKHFDAEDKITIVFSKRNCAIKKENLMIISRILEGDFMDYKSVIPSSEKTAIKVNYETIRDTAERMTLFNNSDLMNPIKTTIGDNELKFNVSSSVGSVNDELECKKTGDDVEIGINSRYLNECLKSIRNSDELTITFNGSLSPALIKPSEDEIHLIVPMRLAK